ncbi:MAG: hypothetical protein IPJ08_09960 [Burkholderiales bacterium]|nr:hypothetical protein [Burkholderiales bacterium]
MSATEAGFGILTMATPGDFRKAIGLALSLRASNPGVPLAVACSPKARPLVARHFDVVVDEDPSLRGFEHKIHMDRYSPFVETVFFDSDVLVFKPVWPLIQAWRSHPYMACGELMTEPMCRLNTVVRTSSFGMDRIAVMQRLGKPALTVIDGAGHAYFRKPACQPVFDMARDVTRQHKQLIGDIPFADEDVIDYVMTAMDIPPAPWANFFSRHLSGSPGTVRMNAVRGECRFVSATTGEVVEPCMMHFAANEVPFAYHRQLFGLFRAHGLSTEGLLGQCLNDWYLRRIRDRLSAMKRRLLRAI